MEDAPDTAKRIQPHRPETFIERGVAVPFTTPLLEGTRVRADDRGAPELIVPSHAGARGVYVMAWSNIHDFCSPTVHDRQLFACIASLPALTPALLRQAVRSVSLDGWAGREAQQAAIAADLRDKADVARATLDLRSALMEHFEAEGERTGDTPARLPPALAPALEAIAPLFAGMSIAGRRTEGEKRLVLRSLAGMCGHLRALMSSWPDKAAEQASAIVKAAELSSACAADALAAAEHLTCDVPSLVVRWLQAPDEVRGLAARPDWLLDGWVRVSQIWTAAEDDDARQSALAEMLLLTPVLPLEAGRWTSRRIEMDAVSRQRRKLNPGPASPSSPAFSTLVQRNERLIAMGM